MRVVAIRQFGGVDVLIDESWAIPSPRPGEVRVRVEATSFNPIDLYWRAGRLDDRLPAVLGRDFAGVVDALGDGVDDLRRGEVVWGYQAGLASNGSYAQYLCLPAELVGRRPSSLAASDAAAVPVAGLTAHRCVMTKARTAPGMAALVAGASGGVGAMIVKLLQLAGASPIIATAGSDRSARTLVDELGLRPEWIVHYQGAARSALADAVRDRNGGQPVATAFDTAGGAMKLLCFDAAAVDGDVVSIVEEPANFALNIWDEQTSPLSMRSLSFHFVEIGARARSSVRANWTLYRQELDWLAERIDDGRLSPPPVTVVGSLSAETARAAHERIATGHSGGKLVMRVT